MFSENRLGEYVQHIEFLKGRVEGRLDVQLVGRLTLGFCSGRDFWVVGSSSMVAGSGLPRVCLSLCPSPCLCLLSLSKTNK